MREAFANRVERGAMWGDVVRFYAAFGKMRSIELFNNHVVALHTKLTPSRATDDTFRAMILENVRWVHRKLDQQAHKQWLKMLKYGRNIDPNYISQEEIDELREERRPLNEDEMAESITEDLELEDNYYVFKGLDVE